MTDLRILKRLFTYYNPTIKQDTWKHVFFMYKKDLRSNVIKLIMLEFKSDDISADILF